MALVAFAPGRVLVTSPTYSSPEQWHVEVLGSRLTSPQQFGGAGSRSTLLRHTVIGVAVGALAREGRRWRSACQVQAQSPRVAVIGAGPAGLATAIALRKEAGVEDVTVFERAPKLQPNVGGGVQLHGSAALLSQLGVPVETVGNPLRGIRSFTAEGDKLLDLDLASLARGLGPLTSSLWLESGELASCTIMRDALLELMVEALPANSIAFERELASLQYKDDSIEVAFKGQEETPSFDLVIAADGIGTVARQSVLNSDSPESPRYTGLRIAYGVRPAGGRRAGAEQEATQHFGEDLYALTATYGGIGQELYEMIAMVYRDDKEVAENVSWSPTDVQASCLKRLKDSGLTGEPTDVASGCERFFELGVFEHPIGLEPWHRGRVVLVGDSAHAMPPFLGQGANQAIQDAVCLAKSLRSISFSSGTASADQIDEALGKYSNQRRLPVGFLAFESNFLGQLETLPGAAGALVRNNAFKIFGDTGVAGLVFMNGAVARVGS